MRAAGRFRPSLGHRHHPGLVDALAEQRAGSIDALVQVEPGLWLLPAAPVDGQPGDVAVAAAVHYALIAELRERFELVLIDSPPLSGLADGLILASQSEAASCWSSAPG